MVISRSMLAFAVLGAGVSLVATPVQAQEPVASAAVGAIDMSRVAQGQAGADGEFQDLFAQWEAIDEGRGVATAVAVPSRMPLDDARMSSDFGMRTHPVLGGRRAHSGIDLAAPTGTPIYATADGYVSRANRFSSYGNFVSIEHGADLQTRYAHLDSIVAKTGTRVRKGDLIGYVGSTGRSTGPHLHYEVRIAGEAVNPVPYMVESQAQQAFALVTGEGGQGDGDE